MTPAIEQEPRPEKLVRIGELIGEMKARASQNKELKLADADDPSDYILDYINELRNAIRNGEFPEDIYDSISDIRSDFRSKYDHYNGETFLEEQDKERLKTKLVRWDEMITQSTNEIEYIHIKPGLVDVGELEENPEQLFKDSGTWQELSDHTRSDIEESCRALACSCYTSSVFMALRAVEERLREWYIQETEREIEGRNFGEVLNEIDDVYSDPDERPAILSNLEFLKQRRNQVAHPDRIPSEREAENTIFMIQDTISSIHDELSNDDS
jgi:HEPN domain-containing protein